MRWEARPVEIANLLNPAFCSLILREAAHTYQTKEGVGVPYPLVFLILPFVLHKKTRESLPNKRAVSFVRWLSRNDFVVLGFAERAKELVPYTREALIFGLQHAILLIDESGSLRASEKLLVYPDTWTVDSTSKVCLARAELVGDWFAETGDPTTIYRALGIRP